MKESELTLLMQSSMDRALEECGVNGMWQRRIDETIPEYDQIYDELKKLSQEGRDFDIKRAMDDLLDHHHMGDHVGISFLEDLQDRDGINLFYLFGGDK
jgi:hypothetical protein